MIVKDISKEIVCEYKEKCRSYNRLSNKSRCPSCLNNKYKNPNDLKDDYYEPRVDYFERFFMVIFVIMIAAMIL